MDAQDLRIMAADGRPIAIWPFRDVEVRGEGSFTTRSGEGRLFVEDADLAVFIAARAAGSRGSWRRPLLWTVAVLAGAAALFFVAVELLPGLAARTPLAWEVRLGDNVRDDAVAVFRRLSGGSGRTCDAEPGRTVLDRLSLRLAAASGEPDFPFAVTVVDIVLPNAVTLPGGRILLFRGLLDKAETPDEVAAVLAHEMAHAIRRHPIRALARANAVGAIAGLVLPGSAEGRLGSGLGQVLLHLSYTRHAETEADDLAFAMLQRAGLRSDGMASLFERLRDTGAVRDGPGLLSTHPDMAGRIARARERAGGGSALSDADWAALRRICDIRPSGSAVLRREPYLPAPPAGAPGGGAARTTVADSTMRSDTSTPALMSAC